MRRSDKEITDKRSMEQIIERSQVCRVAFCKDNAPYVVPLCFGYSEGNVYIHCAAEGMKLDILRANSSVCVEFETDLELVQAREACQCSMKYRSVIAFGHAFLVDDPEAKRKACDIIMAHYAHLEPHYSDDSLGRIAVIKIQIDSMSGKQSGY